MLRAARFEVGLARLSIVNTFEPAATQPHSSRKGRVVAFNGELYNYKQLCPEARSEVEALGLMLDYGLDPRQFLDGDYAIIYYDPSNQTILLYRDRFGMCPLYFQTSPVVAVSSERRRLTGKRVWEVPAHGKVSINLKTRSHRSSLLPHYGITCKSGQNESDVFLNLFLDAVKSRALHSDTGFSAALSGGLDSSAVVLACKALELPVCAAITVVSPENSDDSRYANLIAEYAKLSSHRTIVVGLEEMVEAAPQILEHLDHPYKLPTPLKWRASVRNWFVAKHSPTRVILCGEGADEVIEGYPPHTTRLSGHPYKLSDRQLTAIHSLPAINLDRTNKLGLAHSKEYRAPFLASTLSYWLMSLGKRVGKQILRDALKTLGAPPALLERPKWGTDEKFFDESFSLVARTLRTQESKR